MGNLFQSCFQPAQEKQNTKKVPTEKELTMSRLLDQGDQLLDYKKKIEVQIQRQNNDIKDQVRKNEKSRAMHLINRKQLLEKQLDNIYQKENLIKSMTLQLESTMRQAEFNNVIKESNFLIQNIQNSIDMSVFDDQQDLLQNQKQMNNQLKDQVAQDQYQNQDEIDELYQQYEDMYCEKKPIQQQQQHQPQQQQQQPQQQPQQPQQQPQQQQQQQRIAMLE